jgi:SAM-dependent methyltransferase
MISASSAVHEARALVVAPPVRDSNARYWHGDERNLLLRFDNAMRSPQVRSNRHLAGADSLGMSTTSLPKFADHDGRTKNDRLSGPDTGEPEPAVKNFLAAAVRAGGRVRVLDVGCGRGNRVAWLLEQGWDAWGCDIDAGYLDNGRPYFTEKGWGPDRVRLITSSAELPFDPASFDVILSDQVIEHVADLDAFVAGVARVSAPGAVGLHVYPASWRPVESHMFTPFAHWLPKGPARRKAIRLALQLGQAAPYFTEYDLEAGTEIFNAFSEEGTFYRSRRSVRNTFERYGMAATFRGLAEAKVKARFPALPGLAVSAVGALYTIAHATYLHTVQRRTARVDP